MSEAPFVTVHRQNSRNETTQLLVQEQLAHDVANGTEGDTPDGAGYELELAEEFLANIGFDLSDSDTLGDEFGNTTRNLLAMVILRVGTGTFEDSIR